MVGDQQLITVKKHLFIITALPLLKRQGASFARILAYAESVTMDREVVVWLLSTKYPILDKEEPFKAEERIFICGSEEKDEAKNTFSGRTAGKLFGKKKFRKFLEQTALFLDGKEGAKSVLVYPSINNSKDERELIKMVTARGIRIFSERNELNIGKMLNYPFPKNPLKRILFGIYFPFRYLDHYRQDSLVKRYDGNIAISSRMEQRIKRLNPNVLRIPVLTNVKKFSEAVAQGNDDRIINLGYTGYLTIRKDGIDELIKAAALLRDLYHIGNFRLNLYGEGYRDTLKQLRTLIERLGLSQTVILHGQVPSEEIPGILKQQQILLLTKPGNLQTHYGFSTKLAEYMASGIPVLVTNISDNAMFVTDGENGFITRSHKAGDIAERLSEIISGKEYLDKTISKKALETARQQFDSRKYSDRLVHFLFPDNK